MSVLTQVLESTQPGYKKPVGEALLLLLDTFGEAAFENCALEDFADRVIGLVESRPVSAEVRLQMVSDLSSMAWWCELRMSDATSGALAAVARRTYYAQAQGLPPNRQPPDLGALTSHAVFVGELVSVLHSPTRGAFDYVRALACDPDNRRIEVFHTGPLKPDLAAFGRERLGEGAAKTVFTQVQAGGLASATAAGPRTFHFWCEPAYSVFISLLALFGPTVMFTCGDAAPVQYADVYWYCQEAGYIERLWARKGAPAAFAKNYRATESAPFNKPQPKQRRTRADLGFGEDEVVIVTAGNRLGVDMDQPFVDGMGGLMVENPQLRWVIVGALQDFWVDAFNQVLGERFTHVPFDADLASLFAQCDLFANPFRAGGGNTAIMAVDAGAAVVTRGDIGDVGAFVAPEHLACDADDYFARMSRLVADPALRRSWLDAQRQVLAVRLDQDRFAAELKGLTRLAFDRFSARHPTPLEQIYAQGSPKRLELSGSAPRARLR